MFTAENIAGFLALIITIGIFVLLAISQPVPDPLWAGFGLVLGFFYGNQTGTARARLNAS